ncbi:MAG: transketolase [Nitrospinales bacterium]
MESIQLAVNEIADLRQTARELRRGSLQIIHRAGSGHPGGSLSAADIVAALYFGVMRYDPQCPKDPGRDRFILSKGHCTGLLYVTLARAGFFEESQLQDYRKIDSRLNLSGHPHPATPGVEIATGSLGQGLSVGNGMALAARLDNRDYRVFVLLGDGELQEGQVWEAAMTAAKYNLSQITAIVDYNKLAQDSPTLKLKNLEPLEDKWRSFGWDVLHIDGHDMEQVLRALRAPAHKDKPRVIIADTVKGKGVGFMENNQAWHGVAPNDEQLQQALKDLQ